MCPLGARKDQCTKAGWIGANEWESKMEIGKAEERFNAEGAENAEFAEKRRE
jgi:hypothetical protein